MPPPDLKVSLDADQEEVVDFLKKNADKARRTGNVCVFVTLVIGSIIIATFLYYAQVLTTQRFASQKDFLETNFRLKRDILDLTLQTLDAAKAQPDPAARLAAERTTESLLKSMEVDQDRTRLSYEDIFYNVSSSIIRVGAVLVGIFIIQILVTFSRFYFKMAEHLSMTAALIKLSKGKISDLKAMAPLLLIWDDKGTFKEIARIATGRR